MFSVKILIIVMLIPITELILVFILRKVLQSVVKIRSFLSKSNAMIFSEKDLQVNWR